MFALFNSIASNPVGFFMGFAQRGLAIGVTQWFNDAFITEDNISAVVPDMLETYVGAPTIKRAWDTTSNVTVAAYY